MALKISEVLKTNLNSQTSLTRHIKITNISDEFINNIELTFSSKHTIILEELVVRERGALKFAPALNPIAIGNLSPNETAHLYYTLKPLTTQVALYDDIVLYYDNQESKSFSTQPIEIPLQS